jgi:hypothetical protein
MFLRCCVYFLRRGFPSKNPEAKRKYLLNPPFYSEIRSVLTACHFSISCILWLFIALPQPIDRRDPQTDPSKTSPAWECFEKIINARTSW